MVKLFLGNTPAHTTHTPVGSQSIWVKPIHQLSKFRESAYSQGYVRESAKQTASERMRRNTSTVKNIF